jgi:hypothetical protein
MAEQTPQAGPETDIPVIATQPADPNFPPNTHVARPIRPTAAYDPITGRQIDGGKPFTAAAT